MIVTIVFAILIFSLIIFVHELGHFLAARAFGVGVKEFAIGMGPEIFSRTKNETKYSVRLIPMGGFCAVEGEDEEDDSETSINSKPWYARFVILFAGAGMNLILGFVITLIIVAVSTFNTGIPSSTVGYCIEGADCGNYLQSGDKITQINGRRVNIKKDISYLVSLDTDDTLDVTYLRNGEENTVSVKAYETEGVKTIGFMAEVKKPGVFTVIHESFFQTVWMGKMVFLSLKMLIGGEARFTDLSGPVGVVSVMNDTAQSGGLLSLIFLGAFISVNIGLMNLLPIPALDGGRILFVLVEAIRRKKIDPEKEGYVHMIGFFLLIGLMIFATWNDIVRIFSR